MQATTTTTLIGEALQEAYYLRKEEFYALIPEKSHSSIDKATYQLKKSGQIEGIKLPDQFGIFYKLTLEGDKVLSDRLGFTDEAVPKKPTRSPVEETTQSTPRHWMHHILSCQALAAIKQHLQSDDPAVKIVFERQVRKDYPFLQKIPDGIILQESTYTWLEVENIQKTGSQLLNLADILVKFNQNRMPMLYNRECGQIIVAFPEHHQFCLADVKHKIYESHVGNFTFGVLPLKMQGSQIKAGELIETNILAKGSEILYNNVNKKIFLEDGKNYDNKPSRKINIYKHEVNYHLNEKNYYEWSVSDSHYDKDKPPVKIGVSRTLELCKKDFCSAINQLTNGRKITLAEITVF